MVDSKTNIMLVLVLLSFKNFTGSDYFKNFVLKKHNLQNYVTDRTLVFYPSCFSTVQTGKQSSILETVSQPNIRIGYLLIQF